MVDRAAQASGTVVAVVGAPGSAVWLTVTLPSALPPSERISCGWTSGAVAPWSVPPLEPSAGGVGSVGVVPPVPPSPPLPVFGQLSEGIQANFTSYAAPGARTSCEAAAMGEGRPVAGSPGVCGTTLTLLASAAPRATAETVPEPATVQPRSETLVTRKVP